MGYSLRPKGNSISLEASKRVYRNSVIPDDRHPSAGTRTDCPMLMYHTDRREDSSSSRRQPEHLHTAAPGDVCLRSYEVWEQPNLYL